MAALVALATLTPGLLDAQEAPPPTGGSVALEAVGGLSIPIDELDVLAKTGASYGAGAAIHLSPTVALQIRGERHHLEGLPDSLGTQFPDLTATHLTGGLEVHFAEPEVRWTGALALGAGISHLDSCDPPDGCFPSAVEDFSVTDLSFRGAMKLGYRVTPALTLYLEPSVYLMTIDRDDSRRFAEVSPELELFDVLWTAPVQAGVRVVLP